MKALLKRKREVGIWMEEVDKPTPGPNDLLVKIVRTAICGTDIHIYNWDGWAQRTIPVPMVVGHEYAGVVAELGSAVTGFEVGERISGEGHLVCGHCRNCQAGTRHLCRNTVSVGVNRAGCFAEYLCIPAANAFRLADDISDDIGAILDPFGNATHATLSFDLVGEDVLVTGAGPIGCMSVAIAQHVGARHVVITDINDYRLGLAKQLGASRVVNPTRDELEDVMRELGIVEGFDVGLEMSGSAEAFRSLLANMNNGGRVSLLGIPPNDTAIDWDQVIFKGLVLKGIYGREMFETWYKMKTMLQGGLDISSVITHRFAIDDYAEAFEIMRSGKSGKIVLDWTGSA